MTELHDQDRAFDEVPPDDESDWHQQDKDDRAQGMDREPEPPEDGEQPRFDVAAARKALVASREESCVLGANGMAALDALPAALDEVEALRRELAKWRALPYRDEFGVYHASSEDTEGSRDHSHDPVSALFSAKRFGGTPQTRRIYTGEWVELQDAPF